MMKLQCGCVIFLADKPEAEVKFEPGEIHKMIFCDKHQQGLIDLITSSGQSLADLTEDKDLREDMDKGLQEKVEDYLLSLVQQAKLESLGQVLETEIEFKNIEKGNLN